MSGNRSFSSLGDLLLAAMRKNKKPEHHRQDYLTSLIHAQQGYFVR